MAQKYVSFWLGYGASSKCMCKIHVCVVRGLLNGRRDGINVTNKLSTRRLLGGASRFWDVWVNWQSVSFSGGLSIWVVGLEGSTYFQ